VSAAVDVRAAFRIYPSAGGAAAALQGLDLSVEPGELVVALGPSGSGKTTLLRVVGGFERLSAGTVRVLDTDLARLDESSLARFRAARLGFLDQHYSRALSPGLTCRDTVALQLDLLGSDRRESRARAEELLGRVGLGDRADEEPLSLSGGEQQRVALCAAIAHRPSLLLADEPVGELDAASAETVYAAIAELVRETRATALVVSHDPGAATVADRVVTISDGRVVKESEAGRPGSLVVSRGWIRVPDRDLRALAGPSRLTLERREGPVVALRPAPSHAPRADSADVGASADFPTALPERHADSPVCELRSAAKRYRAAGVERVVFDGLDVAVEAGRLVVIVGRSGTGKTTLLHLLAGLERPSAGDVCLLGRSLAGRSRAALAALRRRHVALVSQEPGLVPHLSASENVALTLRLRGRARSDELVRRALDALGLDARLAHRAATLSAGERQRVAVARALVADTELVLVDEPTARLDRDNARRVGALLARAAAGGRAVVCATHDPGLVELADEVVELPAAVSSATHAAI